MHPWYVKLLAAIVIGLVLPFLFHRFQLTPWSHRWLYWNNFLLCFSIAFLVYTYKRPVAGRSAIKTHLLNFVISFVVLCIAAGVYLLSIALIDAIV